MKTLKIPEAKLKQLISKVLTDTASQDELEVLNLWARDQLKEAK